MADQLIRSMEEKFNSSAKETIFFVTVITELGRFHILLTERATSDHFHDWWYRSCFTENKEVFYSQFTEKKNRHFTCHEIFLPRSQTYKIDEILTHVMFKASSSSTFPPKFPLLLLSKQRLLQLKISNGFCLLRRLCIVSEDQIPQ